MIVIIKRLLLKCLIIFTCVCTLLCIRAFAVSENRAPVNKVTVSNQDTYEIFRPKGDKWVKIDALRLGDSYYFIREDERVLRVVNKTVNSPVTDYTKAYTRDKDVTMALSSIKNARKLIDEHYSVYYDTQYMVNLKRTMNELFYTITDKSKTQYDVILKTNELDYCISETTNLMILDETQYLQNLENMKTILLGSSDGYNDASEINKVNAKVRTAQNLLNSINTADSSVLWESCGSVDMAVNGENSDIVRSLYENVYTLCFAYSHPKSTIYHDSSLYQTIIYCLDTLYEYWYNENTIEYGNWWNWQIGVPTSLCKIMPLIWDELPIMQKNNIAAALNQHFKEDYYITQTGANRVQMAACDLKFGYLYNNGERILRAVWSVEQECRYNELSESQKDGFYIDGGFIQHKGLAYTGSYGNVFLQYLTDFICLVKGTKWEADTKIVDFTYDIIVNSYSPFMVRGSMMDMVNGRSIVRKNNDKSIGFSFISNVLTYVSCIDDSDRQKKLVGMVNRWIEDDTFYNHDTVLSYEHKKILNEVNAPNVQRLTGTKMFNSMDRIVHAKENWTFGLSMFSKRIKTFEQTNLENLQGWYTGSGMTYIYNDDDTQYTNDYWRTVDMYRLPGTTVEQLPRTDTPYVSEKFNTYDFVGGLDFENRYGVAAMELMQFEGSDLYAKKSWFMFDDEIVCIGTQISATGNAETETTVENRRCEDEDIYVNGNRFSGSEYYEETVNNASWANFRNMGYYFPNTVDLKIKHEHREKLPSEVSGKITDTVYAQNDFTVLLLSHGINPVNQSYAYYILPDMNKENTMAYASNPKTEILLLQDTVHAVRNNMQNITAIVNYSNNMVSAGDVTVSGKCIVIVGDASVSLSTPTRDISEVSIVIDRTITFLQQNERVAVSYANGKTLLRFNTADTNGEALLIK